jgi:hypothetical protein
MCEHVNIVNFIRLLKNKLSSRKIFYGIPAYVHKVNMFTEAKTGVFGLFLAFLAGAGKPNL